MDASRAQPSQLSVRGESDRNTSPVTSADSTDTGLLDYAWVLVRHWRLILGIPLVAAVVTGLVSFLLPERFTARVEFVPESSNSIKLPSGLGTLAGEFGLSLPATNPLESPQFYAKVATSRPLLERTLATRFPVAGGADSAALIDILRIRPASPRIRMEKAIKYFRKKAAIKVDNKTGVLQLTVETRSPELSAAVATHMVGLLNDFNRNTRNLQARERRKFAEARTQEAGHDLEQAEDLLRTFLNRNRQYESPQLMFERNRLERQVTLRQEIYGTLRREFEMARLEEVNDTPVLTVVEPAQPPALRSSPLRIRMTLVAGLLGLVVSITLAFLLEYLRSSRLRQPAAYARIAGAWKRGPAAYGVEA